MSKEAAEHHKQSAEHHTHAARHHGEAAKHHESGDHEKAAHHCACRKSNPAILVMQSAEDWAAKDTPCPLNSTR